MGKRNHPDINKALYDLMTKTGLPNGWEPERQQENFRKLLRIVEKTTGKKEDYEGLSFLDVGCGTGDLSENIIGKGGDYLGIDLYQPSLEKARTKHPDTRFERKDLLREPLGEFDFVIASGSLTTKMPDNDAFLDAMVQKMWNIARRGVAFNYLVGGNSDPLIHLYEQKEVDERCARIAAGGLMETEYDEEHQECSTYLIKPAARR